MTVAVCSKPSEIEFQSDKVLFLVFQLDHFAVSTLKVTHQVYACSRSLFFLFKVFFQANLFYSITILSHKRVGVPLILRILALAILSARKAASQLSV